MTSVNYDTQKTVLRHERYAYVKFDIPNIGMIASEFQ